MDQKTLKNRWADAYTRALAEWKKQAPAIPGVPSVEEQNQLEFLYLNTPCRLSWPEGNFHPATLSAAEKILILHYFTARPRPEPGKEYLSYHQLPGGMFYASAYRKNGPARILSLFSRQPDWLLPAARRLGGVPANYGDIAVKLPVLPGLELLIILYRGDDEFPAEVNILFQAEITSYLSLEDISLLAGFVASRLAGSLQQI